MRQLFAVLTLTILLFSVTIAHAVIGIKPPAGTEELSDLIYRTGWVLAIGIDKYTPSDFQRKYASADVDAFTKLIQSKYGFEKKNMTILKNDQATKKNIMDALNSYKDQKTFSKEDCLIVFFVGQAKSFPNPSGDGELGFLITYDPKLDLSKETTIEAYKNCVSTDELKEAFKNTEIRHILFLADACFDGMKFEDTKTNNNRLPSYLIRISASNGLQAINAGKNVEKPIDLDDAKHGLFTQTLLKMLEGTDADGNNDGLLTGSEISFYLTKQIAEASKGKLGPQFFSSGYGEFSFVAQTEAKKVENETKKEETKKTKPGQITRDNAAAIIEMELGGRIVIEFYPQDAPNHVDNFIKLAKKGFYNGVKFHRVEPKLLIQGGDPDGTGRGGPGYSIKAEFNSQKHVRGTVAMARKPDPDSAGSQFYICLTPLPSLNGQYTVFGQVVEGMDVADGIKKGDVMKKVTIVDKETIKKAE